MKTKYFYTQDAETPTTKLLDKYKEGETKTIATYDTITGNVVAVLKLEDKKALNNFVAYFKQWHE